MGAWIETFTNPNNVCGGQSHPTWVRGLKLFDLKTAIAWHIVAPHVGAWIETRDTFCTSKGYDVAPHVGAWIETACLRSSLRWDMSHPTWVRGLKLFVSLVVPVDVGSHPTWVRGLKLRMVHSISVVCAVAPHVGAWIETWRAFIRVSICDVAPHVGAWIETLAMSDWTEVNAVAPHVGAWIETIIGQRISKWVAKSHPTWVRGLKRKAMATKTKFGMSHPTWVRGLKPSLRCRAPLG